VVYSAMDAEGNMVQCSFSVTVFDNIDPTITCPLDIVASADPGVCTYTADVSPVVDDNCAVDRVEYDMTGASAGSGVIYTADLPDTLGGFAFAVGTTYVTYTVYDEQGNSVDCMYSVVITDDEDPIIDCPDDYLVGTSGTIYANGLTGATLPLDQLVYTGSDCETTVDSLIITTTDNCCVSSVQYRILNAADSSIYRNWEAFANLPTPPDGDQILDLSSQIFEKGEWIVELRSWDCHMNEGLCDFVVTVFDDEAPAFDYCPDDIVMDNLPGECFNNAGWHEPELEDILDNCLPECPVSLEGPYVSFDSDADLANIDPTITVFGDGNVFAAFPVGVRYIKYKATDDAGNTVFCIFSVTINDVEKPTIECPENSTLTFDFDCDTLTLGDYRGLAIVDDNCGIDVGATTQSPAPGTLISDIAGITPNTGESFVVTITTYDHSGNSESCDFTITIEDNVGPTIACPANQIVMTGPDDTDCMVPLADYRDEATAQVACGTEEPTVTQDPAPGTMIAGPINIIELIATDSQGNSTSCLFNVGVVDNTPPTGFCYADPDTVTAAIGECEADVLLRAPSVSDNCDADLSLKGVRSDGEADIIASSGAFFNATFSVYVTTITWIATDDAGNSAEICQNTVVVDEAMNEANEPNAGCTDKTFGLKNSGTVTLCADDIGSGTDNCENGELTLLLHVEGSGEEPSECITFDCDDIGTFEICLIVIDQSGNEDRCYSYLTIQDKRDPHIKCPADITIACHTDNDGDPDPGVDVPFPAISPFSQVDFDAWNPATDAGADAVLGITGAPLAMDNCGGTVTYSDESTQGDDPTQCDFYTYMITRTWRVEDNEGAVDSCDQVITVKDTIAPYFTTAPNMLDRFINCDDPNAGLYLGYALDLEPEAEDLCYVELELISDDTLTFEGCTSWLGQPNVFEQRVRVWQATDACGNSVTYEQRISFQDFTAPAIVCPNDGATIDVTTDADLCSTFVPLLASATDCQEVEFWYNVKNVNTGAVAGPFAGNDASQTFGPGNYCIEFYAEDPCGNQSSCQTFVNVTDDQAPTINCDFTNDVTVGSSSSEDACEGVAVITAPLIDDNCAAELRIFGEGAADIFDQAFPFAGFTFGQPLPVGVTTLYWYAIDEEGNSSDTCVQVITVIDDIAPVEIGPNFCPEDVTLYTSMDGFANYNCSAPYNWKTPDLADDCGVVSYQCVITQGENTLLGPEETTNSSSLTFQFPVGTSTVAYLATDAAGNSWTCSFDVTVIDDEDPVVVCQDLFLFLGPDGTASIAATEADPNPLTINGGSYDNCEAFFYVSQSQFSCADLGENLVILTVFDAAGHTVSCEATVTVIDPLPPTIECAADTTVTTTGDGVPGDCHYEAGTEFDPEIADNTALGDNARTIDGSGPWAGFMNVFETPENGGAPAFATGWGVADIVALIDAGTNTVELKPNRIGDLDPYWFNPDGSGNKIMEGSAFIPANELLGQTFTFSGEVTSNDLDEDYIAYAFIRVFTADFSVLLEENTAALVAGETFTVAYLNSQPTAGQIQYGFTIRGRAANPRTADGTSPFYDPVDGAFWDAAYEALGSVVIGSVEACDLTLTNDYNGEASLDGESFSATGSPYSITWTVEDVAGNSATCTNTITVLDDELPSFSYCPDDISLPALTNNCLALASWTEPTLGDVDDNCGVASLAGPFSSDPTVQILGQSNGNAFGNFPIGTTTVSYVVTDLSGNTSTCEFTVTVTDTQAPLVLFFQDYYEYDFDPNVCGATVDVLPPVCYDQCGDLSYLCLNTGTSSGLDDYPAGEETAVTWIVTDEAGNSSVMTATVKVGRIGPASNLQAICRPDKGFMKLKFDPAPGAQRYLIQVREQGGTEFLWVERNYNSNIHVAYLPMDTLPPGNYQWRVVSLCKLDDSPNLPGWTEYTKRYTSWRNISMPCGTAIVEGGEDAAANKLLSEEIYSVDIFPNPNTGEFSIRTDMEIFNLEVMDAEGKLVHRQDRVTDQFMTLDLEELNNGIYLVRLISDDAVVTKRVTIQR
ncbi:MAG: HYR domain-containing protein, partial [Flavobacteriales bacterium]|nr:HYR domain-containing protein [Flavobacteriales bacterium]